MIVWVVRRVHSNVEQLLRPHQDPHQLSKTVTQRELTQFTTGTQRSSHIELVYNQNLHQSKKSTSKQAIFYHHTFAGINLKHFWKCWHLPKSAASPSCHSCKLFSPWSQFPLCSRRPVWRCHRRIWRGRMFYPRCCCQWSGAWTCNQNFGLKYLSAWIWHLLLKPSKKMTNMEKEQI